MSDTPGDEAGELDVEVTFALPEQQYNLELRVPSGTTAAQALQLSGLLERAAEHGYSNPTIGIWGETVAEPQHRELCNGDRVEIYRPLLIDPREARRRRAAGES